MLWGGYYFLLEDDSVDETDFNSNMIRFIDLITHCSLFNYFYSWCIHINFADIHKLKSKMEKLANID